MRSVAQRHLLIWTGRKTLRQSFALFQERVKGFADLGPSLSRETIQNVVSHMKTLKQEVTRLRTQLSEVEARLLHCKGAKTHKKTLREHPVIVSMK